MSKDIIDKAADAVKDVRDGVKEEAHRGAADAERANREAAGDTMTTGEKMRSGIDEAKHRLEAEGDKAKRAIRDNT